MNKTAECCCGKNKLVVSGDPITHSVCNCSNCKKRTGSAFGISAYFKSSQIISKPNSQLSTYEFRHEELEHIQKRFFCRSCGTTLFWYISTFKDTVGVAAGCLTGTPLPEPTFNYHSKQKCHWVTFAKTLQVIE